MGKFKIKTNPVSDTLDFTVLAVDTFRVNFSTMITDWIEIIL